MNAETTARRVLAWAADPAGPVGPLPEGPLWDAAQLARPEPATRQLVAELARRTAATLGTGAAAFGDRHPCGLGPVLLAAAVGGRRQPALAHRLAQLLPAAAPIRSRLADARWRDLLARHGLVTPVLAALTGGPAPHAEPPAAGRPGAKPLAADHPRADRASSDRASSDRAAGDRAAGDHPDEGSAGGDPLPEEPLAETLLRASPLTAVLHRPALGPLAKDATGKERETAAALAAQPPGPAVLAAALAAWSPQEPVLKWRKELLHLNRFDNRDLVLDTYTLARLRHGADWDARLRWAGRRLRTPGPPDPLALATVDYWTPLAAIQREGDAALAVARPLLAGYQYALWLVGHYRLTTARSA